MFNKLNGQFRKPTSDKIKELKAIAAGKASLDAMKPPQTYVVIREVNGLIRDVKGEGGETYSLDNETMTPEQYETWKGRLRECDSVLLFVQYSTREEAAIRQEHNAPLPDGNYPCNVVNFIPADNCEPIIEPEPITTHYSDSIEDVLPEPEPEINEPQEVALVAVPTGKKNYGKLSEYGESWGLIMIN